MAWASSGGFPGVVSTGPGALSVPGGLATSSLGVTAGGQLQMLGSGGSVLLWLLESINNGGLELHNGVGLFGAVPPAAPTTGGNHTAGGTYTATEEAMLNAVYTALRSIGLVT